MKLKKVLLVAGIVGLGIAFVGTGTVKKYASYIKQEAQALADKASTPEREIERLREEVQKLDKVEKEIKDELANEIYQFERVSKQTAELRTKVGKEREETLAFADSIKTAEEQKGQVSYGRRAMSIGDAKRQLKADVDAVDKREKTLGSMETSLAHREEAKKLLTAQMNEIQNLRQTLSNELDALEVEYKALKLQAMQNKYTRDDSRWSAVRDGIEKLKEKVEVKRFRVGLDTGKGKIDGPVTESVDEITSKLTGKKAGDKGGD